MSKTGETHAISTRTRPLYEICKLGGKWRIQLLCVRLPAFYGRAQYTLMVFKVKVSFTELSFWCALNDYFLMSVFVTTYERSQIIEDKIKTITLSWRNLLRKSKRNQRVHAAQTHAPRARASRHRFPWSTKKFSKKICKRVAGIKRKVGRSPMRF